MTDKICFFFLYQYSSSSLRASLHFAPLREILSWMPDQVGNDK